MIELDTDTETLATLLATNTGKSVDDVVYRALIAWGEAQGLSKQMWPSLGALLAAHVRLGTLRDDMFDQPWAKREFGVDFE